MKIYSAILTALLFSTAAYASGTELRAVECTPAETTSLNRFTAQGNIETTEKGLTSGEISLTTQMAGKHTATSDTLVLSVSGTARTYPTKTLGIDEVTLVRLKSELLGRIYSLTIASGLSGPQSTLTVQGIPFRAECKLK